MSLVHHQFVLVLDRRPADHHDWDLLAEAVPNTGWTLPRDGSPAFGDFDQYAPDLAQAIAEAAMGLEEAGFRATAVRAVELVRDDTISSRVGLPWPTINAAVAWSPSFHPKPRRSQRGHYRWSEIAAWLAAHGVGQSYDHTTQVADAVLRADPPGRLPELTAQIRQEVAKCL